MQGNGEGERRVAIKSGARINEEAIGASHLVREEAHGMPNERVTMDFLVRMGGRLALGRRCTKPTPARVSDPNTLASDPPPQNRRKNKAHLTHARRTRSAAQ